MKSIEKITWFAALALGLAMMPSTVLAHGEEHHEDEHAHEEPAVKTHDHGDGHAHSHAKKKLGKFGKIAKRNKQLKRVFPEAKSFRPTAYSLSKKQATGIQKKLRGKLKKADKKGRIFTAYGPKFVPLGTVVFVAAKEIDKHAMTTGVGLNLDGSIANVIAFTHHDDTPWAEPKWLKQFIGKSPADDWHRGHTIMLIEGYEQSSWQMAKVIRKAMLINQKINGTSKKSPKAASHGHDHEGGHGDDHAH